MNATEGQQTEGDWSPQPEQLVESMRMLQALRDPTRPDHGRAVASLDEHVTNPSFVLIMMHVFSSGAQYQSQGLTPDLRQLAGLVIKNYVFPHLVRLPSNVQAMLKREVVRVLQDSIPDIRKTAAILAGKISESFPITTWSDIMPPILQMLDLNLYTAHPTVVQGSLEAIQRICEDSSLKLALDEINRPLDSLIPRLLALMTCPEASIRIGALSSYNSLLYLLSPRNYSSDSLRSRNSSFNDTTEDSAHSSGGASAGGSGGGELRAFSPANATPTSPNLGSMGNASHPLIMHMNAFIQRLSVLASDPHPKVRTVVCQAITTISTNHVAVLDPYFNDICQFMLVALQDTEECVAIESCEFWGVMTEQADTKRAVMPYLRTLIEHLISRLYLTEEQMENERIDEEEENSGEKELNLRPIHHKAGNNNNSTYSGSTSGGSGGSGGGDNSGDQEKESNELSAKWTLRKQAALLLDNVALSFPPHDILAAALPKIQEFFQHPNVLVKECGMLALGALSTGCLDEMAQYIPQLFPFLLQNIQDPLPEMRCISCWVLSRYCCLFSEAGDDGAALYTQSLQAFLTTMFDPKPKAQVAACSALCVLIENSYYTDDDNILSAHLPAIFTSIHRAFEVYGVKSSLVLVDTIGTIADSVGQELRNPQYTQLYLPRLVQKFNELDDQDMRMFPMLECLSSVLSAIGLEAQQYVLHIYTRCLRIVSSVLQAHAAASARSLQTGQSTDDDELPSKDFAICGLDVISALCEGLGSMFATLVLNAHSRDALFECMFAAIADDLPELRQSGYSLAGELCKHVFSQLVDHAVASRILQCAIQSLDTDYPLVCNNAAWTIGELAMQAGGEFLQPYIPRAMNSLITALQTAHLSENIKTNVAVTIGRLAIVDTLEVAELADEYFADWCSVLELPCPTAERIHAYTGMLNMLHQNPNVLLGNKTHIYSYLVALVAWPDAPPAELRTSLRDILLAVRANNTLMFDKVLLKFGLHYPVSTLVQLYELPM